MEDNSIEYSRHLAIIRDEMLRHSFLFQQSLKISRDGNQFCVLLGENLHDGVAGFGNTLMDAMHDFDRNMQVPIEKK